MDISKRDEEMKRLRLEEGMRLQDIADIYDLTRERVRQIVGNTGFLYHKKIREKIANEDRNLTNCDLSRKYDRSRISVSRNRSGMYARCGDSYTSSAMRMKLALMEWIKEQGHVVSDIDNGRQDAFYVDDIKVGVRVGACTIPPSLEDKLVNVRYSFCVEMYDDSKTQVDFFVCLCRDTGDAFIIPRTAIPRRKMRIQFVWPTARPEIGKYQKYHERWDLIFGGNNAQ